MVSLGRLRAVWQLVRETDVQAIRADAERAFTLLVLAEARADAEAAARLLSGPGPEPRFVLARAATDGLPEGPDLALLLTAAGQGSGPSLAAAGAALREAAVPFAFVSADADLPTLARELMALAGPGQRLALARRLPPLREAIIGELIEETARANAIYALTAGVAETVPLLGAPLNVADVVVLTKNQLVMAYKIALATGRSGAPRELIGQMLGVIGGGFLLRQGARSLAGLIPVLGIAPKVGVAYAGTLALGRMAAAWGAGRPVSPATARKLYREALARGREVAKALRS